jgi:hypothetical protein
LATLEPELFDYVLSQLDANLPVLIRLAAASALSQLHLNDDQLTRLTPAVAGASAVEISHLLAANSHH